MRELSKRGAGPGEYRYIHSLRADAESALTWYDPVLRRVTSLPLNSDLSVTTTAISPAFPLSGMWLSRGGVIALEVPSVTRYGDSVDALFQEVVADRPARPRARVRRASTFRPGTPVPTAPPLFSPNVLADANWYGDIAHSTGAAFVVVAFPATGEPWTLRVRIPFRRVLPVERDSAIAEELRSSAVQRIAELPSTTRERITRAAALHPQIAALKVLRDGTIWIGTTPARAARTTRWDIFARNGARVGYVELPLNASIRDGNRQWILVVIPQQDDGLSVVRFNVSP